MKIAVGADHAGYELKDQLAGALRKAGHQVTDFGTNSGDPPITRITRAR